MNEYNVLFPRNEEGKVDVKRGVYETNIQLEVAKVESKEHGEITGKHCPVFDYTGKKIVTVDAYKKNVNELPRIRKLT